MELKAKRDTKVALERIEAWLNKSIIDRVPVQFHRHDMTVRVDKYIGNWNSLKDRWFDSEYQVTKFLNSVKERSYLAETFPVFWPNLGPDVFAALYGIELDYAEETSYAIHSEKSLVEMNEQFHFSTENHYFKKLEEMMQLAIEMSEGQFFVGYSDFHPGMDTLAAWRNPEALCLDLLLEPENVKQLLQKSIKDFQWVFDHFYNLLQSHGHPCVNWMEVPVEGKLHIPSCDFSALISPEDFIEFNLPLLLKEVKGMDYNIFHLDGPGVAKHIDAILSVKEINAIQWVQGEGDHKAIEPWKPLIRKIQEVGKSVLVMLQPSELNGFISDMKPDGILLSIPSSSEEEELSMLKEIEKWK